jgi:transcriptional regulator with XRE-family HTH domain
VAIGESVKQARKARGWTREQLAIEAGVSFTTVANVERGAGATVGTIQKFAEALGVSLADLFKTNGDAA